MAKVKKLQTKTPIFIAYIYIWHFILFVHSIFREYILIPKQWLCDSANYISFFLEGGIYSGYTTLSLKVWPNATALNWGTLSVWICPSSNHMLMLYDWRGWEAMEPGTIKLLVLLVPQAFVAAYKQSNYLIHQPFLCHLWHLLLPALQYRRC